MISGKILLQVALIWLAVLAGLALIIITVPGPDNTLKWSAPVNLSFPGEQADDPQIAAGADLTTVIWNNNNTIQTRTRFPNSKTFTIAENMSTTGQNSDSAQVVIGADGTTTVVWISVNSSKRIVQARTRLPGSKTFSAAVNLSSPALNVNYPQIAIAANGTTTVVWQSGRTIQARTRQAGSESFAAEQLFTAQQTSNSRPQMRPQIAVADNGAVTVVWVSEINNVNSIVQARTRPAGSETFGPVMELSSPLKSANAPQLAMAANGAAIAAWNSGDDGSNSVIEARARPAGSSVFTATEILSNPGRYSLNPEVIITADGTATVVWLSVNEFLSDSRLQLSTRQAGSKTFSADQTLSGTRAGASSPQLAAADNGATTVIWSLWKKTNNILQARTRPAGSKTFSAVEILSGKRRSSHFPKIVADEGALTVAWISSTSDSSILQTRTSIR